MLSPGAGPGFPRRIFRLLLIGAVPLSSRVVPEIPTAFPERVKISAAVRNRFTYPLVNLALGNGLSSDSSSPPRL